jgi:hypothetical protein
MSTIQLTVSRDEARRRIQEQIKEGEEIVRRQPHDWDSGEKLLNDRKVWAGFTEEVLRQSFTETEYGDNFAAEWDAAVMYGSGEDLAQQIEIAVAGTKDQLGVLRTIARNVEILKEPPPSATPLKGPVTRSPLKSAITIFISHSKDDKIAAEALASLFRSALSIAPDKIRCASALAHSLPYGADATETLRNEVATAGIVVGLVTPSSVQSHWVLFELGARWGQRGSLVCVLAAGAGFDILPAPIKDPHALEVVAGEPEASR